MSVEHITSKANSNIKYVKKLVLSAKFRRENRQFALEGLRLCRDAVLNGYFPVSLFYTKAAEEKSHDEIEQLKNAAGACFEVSGDVFSAMSDTVSPQGVMCVMNMQGDCEKSLENGGKYAVIKGVATPDNVGAVARTAEAFGVNALVALGGCDVHNPKAMRASMGALLRLPVLTMSDDEFFERCDEYGIKTYASTPRSSALKIGSFDFNGGCAIVIGNEANGLPDEFIDKCDFAVTIEMKGKAESLNAAAAAAVLVYEMMK